MLEAMRRAFLTALVLLGLLAPAAPADRSTAPVARASAVCADFPNQAAAQRAHDTRDADGDGIYCESLPCPCSSAKSGGTPSCKRTSRVLGLVFSARKYPDIRRHTNAAIRRGWPRVLTLHRAGAGGRRTIGIESLPTRPGYDRDEYPPALARRHSKTDVAYVPSHENRSHGAALGDYLRGYCDGTRFKYVFR
jgi:hypothetical protein